MSVIWRCRQSWPPSLDRYLGDIVIAYPYTMQQAAHFGSTPAAELRLMVVHGVLLRRVVVTECSLDASLRLRRVARLEGAFRRQPDLRAVTCRRYRGGETRRPRFRSRARRTRAARPRGER